MDKMRNLEGRIRDLVIAMSLENFEINKVRSRGKDSYRDYQLYIRKMRLSKLSSLCSLNIDKEIDFFKNN